MNKNFFVAMLAIVVVGAAGLYLGLWDISMKKLITPPGAADRSGELERVDGTTIAGFAALGPNAIYVADQWPQSEIVVTIVNIASPGYVVVHESQGGAAGVILGASPLIEAGENKNVKVALTRSAKDREELVAMLHAESGTTGFDASADLPVRDSAGNAVNMIFTVSGDAPNLADVQVMF